MTADRNPPRVLRYIMVFIGLVLVAFLISVIAHVRTVRHYNERAGYAKQQVEKLKSRCPKNVSAEKWDRGVDWTSNAISQIYFSPSHGDLESLESLCQFLDQETEKDVGLKTLRSIWDEYEKARGRSQRLALRFRDIRLLTEEPVTDDDLVDLWSLDRCLYLDLNNTAVTDAGMRHLADSRLESLELWNTKVGDAGIKLNLNGHSNKDPQRNPVFFNEKSSRILEKKMRSLATRGLKGVRGLGVAELWIRSVG